MQSKLLGESTSSPGRCSELHLIPRLLPLLPPVSRSRRHKRSFSRPLFAFLFPKPRNFAMAPNFSGWRVLDRSALDCRARLNPETVEQMSPPPPSSGDQEKGGGGTVPSLRLDVIKKAVAEGLGDGGGQGDGKSEKSAKEKYDEQVGRKPQTLNL